MIRLWDLEENIHIKIKRTKCLAKTSYKMEKDSDIKFVVDQIKFVKQLTQSDGKDVWIVGAQI